MELVFNKLLINVHVGGLRDEIEIWEESIFNFCKCWDWIIRYINLLIISAFVQDMLHVYKYLFVNDNSQIEGE